MVKRILIADTNILIREGLRSILSSVSGSFKVEDAKTRKEVFSRIQTKLPDLILIDHTFLHPGDIEEISAGMKGRVICLTGEVTYDKIETAIKSGVKGYIFKDCELNEIIEAVDHVGRDQNYFCGKIIEKINNSQARPGILSCQGVSISEREAEIIRMIAGGHTNKEIADLLCLSSHTVTTHRKNIMNKLDLTNTAGLVLFAIKENLIKA